MAGHLHQGAEVAASGSARKRSAARLANRELLEGLARLDDQRREGLQALVAQHGERAVARVSSQHNMAALFDRWTEKDPGQTRCRYDIHMEQHDAAVRKLIRMVLAAHMVSAANEPRSQKTLLELSCCTGSVIQSVVEELRLVDHAAANNLRVVANDLSTGGQNEAREKLAAIGVVPTFIQHDIRFSLPQEPMDIVILSQTLHLLADPELLLKERLGEITKNDEDHRPIKTRTIARVFERLRKGGLFIMIDEWPPLLTRRSSTSPRLDPEIEAQFEGTFRPVHTKSDLRDKVMANVPEARFVAEFRIKIDEYHSMTVFVYMKDPLKSRSRKKPWPSTRKEARSQDTCLEQCTRARQAAFERLLAKFRAVDDIFVREYLAINGERELWEIVKPFSTQGQAVFNDPTVVEIPQGSKYDVIVLPSLHNIREDTRPKLIADAIEALNQGGILLFTGEWPAPKRSRHPLDKRAMRNGLVEPHLKDLIFEAALREPISAGYASALYLWAYRKR